MNLKNLVESQDVCGLPWTQIEINLASNFIKPCCRFKESLGKVTDGIKPVWFNNFSDLREDFKSSNIVLNCNACNVKSQSFSYKNWKTSAYLDLGIFDNVDTTNIQLPKVFHISLDNACNLACRMCFPAASTKLEKLAKNSDLSKFYTMPSHQNEININNFSGSFVNAEFITISGGEPLVNKKCFALIDQILAESSNVKFINFSTNLTVLNQKLFNKLALLPATIAISISIDGPPHIHEFIRSCSWQKIYENIKFLKSNYPQFKLAINSTLSSLNVGYIDETILNLQSVEDNLNFKFERIKFGPVLELNLHAGVLPQPIKDSYIKKLQELDLTKFTIPFSTTGISTALDLLAVDLHQHTSTFLEFNQIFDSATNKSITDVYQEFKPYF